MDLDVEAIREKDVSVIALRGEIDVYTAPLLRQKIVDLVDEGALNIVVDMEKVDFLDSTGLGVLVEGLKRVKTRGGTLSLVATQDKILKIFDITGLNKATDVTLKRGIIGSLNLYQWLNQIRNGDQGALRTVVIQLQNEDHTAVVQEWKLMRARIIKHVSGPFNAKGTDVAMEELTLAYERLEME